MIVFLILNSFTVVSAEKDFLFIPSKPNIKNFANLESFSKMCGMMIMTAVLVTEVLCYEIVGKTL